MRSIIFASSLILATVALAHEGLGPNGGRLVEAGDFHMELVSKGKAVDVFVTDANDKPVPVEGYKGHGSARDRRQAATHSAGAGKRKPPQRRRRHRSSKNAARGCAIAVAERRVGAGALSVAGLVREGGQDWCAQHRMHG